jgi:nucleotide-binding universal stress UspA family protein
VQKILVTTDFSDKSKAGLRFAIQLASQHPFQLVFYSVCHLSIPSSWSILKTGDYEKAELKKTREKLVLFVGKIYKQMNMVQGPSRCIVKSFPMPQSAIIDYAAKNKFSFISISTRGAGKLERLLGTNTANLINYSSVPVMAIPHAYRASSIKSILYASDLLNLGKELKRVVAFARPLHAKVELLHFTSFFEKVIDNKDIVSAIKKNADYDIKLQVKNREPVESLVADIEAAIKTTKPSMLIMFTEQNRNLFQKIFASSKSASYSFHGKVPLLVFNKS